VLVVFKFFKLILKKFYLKSKFNINILIQLKEIEFNQIFKIEK